MKIYNVGNFPYEVLATYENLEKPKRARGKRYERKYKNVVCSFDIEATNIRDIKQSVMYVWQFALDEYFVCVGRTWDEFKLFLSRLVEYLKKYVYLCVYVHNLSYEFEFLQGQFDIKSSDVFAIKSRKILNLRLLNHFEFRCSYLQSNMSLDVFTDKMQVAHKKLSGEEYDYTKQRFYYTALSEKELKYCVNDVVGVVECIKTELKTDNDTLYTIPYTSTGYVRRDMKQALKECKYNWLKSLQPSFETYIMLRKAFRGGNTHANRFYVCDRDDTGAIFDNDEVITMDMTSAYPAVILNKLFPVSEFKKVERPSISILETCIKQNKACLMHIRFNNVSLKNNNYGCPYLAKDKCINIKNAIYDNGRILCADSVETWLTDIDYNIIKDIYNFDYENTIVYNLHIAKYGSLPDSIKAVVRKYFKMKTELKDIDGKEIFYTKMKNLLNAIYGMFAQNPVIFDLEYEEETENIKGNVQVIKILGRTLKRFHNPIERADYGDCKTESEIYEKRERLRKEFIKNKIEELQTRAGFPYQWGVWVCSWCRYMLHLGIENVGKYYDPFMCYFVYCDTDSVKYSDPEKRVKWDELNNTIKAESLKNDGVAIDKKGNTHIIGIYEPDKHTAKKFRTMGAKRYVYVDENEELHITIAGVNKEKGAKQLQEMGGISAFKDNITFYNVNTTATYNDCGGENYTTPDGVEIEIPPNLYLEECNETIKRGKDYLQLTIETANDFMNKFGAYCEKSYLNVDIYD